MAASIGSYMLALALACLYCAVRLAQRAPNAPMPGACWALAGLFLFLAAGMAACHYGARRA